MSQNTHPEKQRLADYVSGKLAEIEASVVAEHLNECQECETTIQALEAKSETLVTGLKEPAPADPYAGESELRQAAANVTRLAANTQAAPATSAAGPKPATKAPVKLGPYQLLAKLGEGGMGAVFKARHEHLDKIVALKVLPKKAMQDAAAVARFRREMKAVGALHHPNIVGAHDAGETQGVHFLVMEYVPGSDLSSLVKKHGPVTVEQAISYITQAARGLAFAHSKNIVHRDIKPANLLVDEAGTVKILDMGLARLDDGSLANAEANQGLTQTGQVMGTVDYMAPEQAFDTHRADAKADVYSLGCTLYRILTGQNAFNGDTVVQKILAHREQPIPSLTKLRPETPAALDAIYVRMMAKQPEQRPSMAELVRELEALANPRVVSSASIVVDHKAATTGRVVVNDLGVKPTAKPSASTGGRGSRPTRKLIAAGFGGFALLAATIWFIIRDKDGKEIARVQAPDGSSVTMQGEPVASVTKVSEPPIKPPVVPTTSAKLTPYEILTSPDYEWTVPENLGPTVNTSGDDDLIGLTSDEQRLYFRANDSAGIHRSYEAGRGSSTKPFGNAQIGQPTTTDAYLSGDGLTLVAIARTDANLHDLTLRRRPSLKAPWRQEEEIGPGINTPLDERYPSLSPDGLALLFTRPRITEQGTRGRELWISRRASPDVSFGQPEKLGPEINKPGEYVNGAAMLADGQTLIFRRNGILHVGIIRQQEAGSVVPLPNHPLGDEPKDHPLDLWIAPDGDTVYFDANRPGGLGGGDIWVTRRIRAGSSTTPAATSTVATETAGGPTPFQGKYYRAFTDNLSWHAARDRCAALGGHLAIVRSAEEQTFLVSMLRSAGIDAAWIGATDEKKEGEWLWPDGSKVDYAAWDTAQPNNKPPGEHYAAIVVNFQGKPYNGRWSDQPAVADQHPSVGYICQWETLPGVATPRPVLPIDDYALRFAGGASVEVPTLNGAIDPAGPLTVECWLAPGYYYSGQPEQPGSPLVKFEGEVPCLGSHGGPFYVCINNSGGFDFRLFTNQTLTGLGGEGNPPLALAKPGERGGKFTYIGGGGSNVAKQQPIHLACVRSQGKAQFYVGGKLHYSKDLPPVTLAKSKEPFRIGGKRHDKDVWFYGVINEVRVSKTVRYDQDFTPPTRFESDPNTTALYHFDEATGDELHDASGNKHDGKIIGAKWVRADGSAIPSQSRTDVGVPHPGDYALQFDGVDDHVELSSLVLDFAKPFTIEAAVQTTENDRQMQIVSNEKGHRDVLLALNPDHVVGIIRNSANGPLRQFSPTGPRTVDGGWHNVAFVWDGKRAVVYWDGAQVAADDTDRGPMVPSNVPLWIGARPNPQNFLGFNGRIDEVRISKVARYAQQYTPQAHFESDPNTTALYHFDEATGDVLHDASGNKHDGKIIGAKWVRGDGSAIASPNVVATPTKIPAGNNGSATTPARWNTPEFQAWLADTQKLSAEKQLEAVSKKLMELNPGFDGKLTGVELRPEPKVENGIVVELGFLGVEIADLSPVRALAGLKKLGCSGLGAQRAKFADLSPLVDLQLDYLAITGSEVTDLTPLQGMPLATVHCAGTRVGSLLALRGAPLTRLLCKSTRVTDLTPLAGMQLKIFECNGLVSDISPLAGMPLNTLQIEHTPVTDLSPLATCKDLKSLKVGAKMTAEQIAALQQALPACKIEVVGPAKTSAKPLAYLDPTFQKWVDETQKLPAEQQLEEFSKKLIELNPGFDGKLVGGWGNTTPVIKNGVVTGVGFDSAQVADISPVRVFAGLTDLYCVANPRPNGFGPAGILVDLSPLVGMPLTSLHVGNVPVIDLSPLRGMPLKSLGIYQTQVTDLSPLVGMPLEHLHMNGARMVTSIEPLRGMPLKRLSMNQLPISDLSPLAGMKLDNLSIAGTPVADLAALRGMPLRDWVDLSGTKVTDLSPLHDCPTLKEIDLSRVNIAPVEISKLLQAVPECKVKFSMPGDLPTVTEALRETNPDRRVARWVLARGGRVDVLRAGDERARGITADKDLPAEPFWVTWVQVPSSSSDISAAEWQSLGELRLVSGIDVNGCRPTNEALAAIGRCRSLQSLNFAGAPSFDDQGLQQLVGLFRLRYLDLNGCGHTAAGLETLGKLTSLRVLKLGTKSLQVESFKPLQSLDRLYQLDVNNARVSNQAVGDLAALPQLRLLNLRSPGVTPAVIDELLKLRGLYVVSLEDLKYPAATLRKLVDHPTLSLINTHGSGIKPEEYVELAKSLPRLTFLHPELQTINAAEIAALDWAVKISVVSGYDQQLRGYKPHNAELTMTINKAFPPADFQHLAKVKNLTRILLNIDTSSDEHLRVLFESLREFPHLLSLTLRNAKLQNSAALADLPRHAGLDSFELVNSNGVTDESLSALSKLPNLSRITLESDSLTDGMFKHLKPLAGLESLSLTRATQVTGGRLSELRDKPRLWRLHLTATGVTDAALAGLVELPALEELWLNKTAISDTGLQRLAGCKQLRVLNVVGTKVTPAGIVALQKSLPNCLVLHDSGIGLPTAVQAQNRVQVENGALGTKPSGVADRSANQAVAPPVAKSPFHAAQARAQQEQWAKHLGTTVETTNSVGAKMVLVPPGEFLMGSTAEQIADALKVAEEVKAAPLTKQSIEKAERPRRQVVITTPFLMGATEVTIGQFRKFVDATKYVTEAEQYGFGNSTEKELTNKVGTKDKGAHWRAPGYVVADDSPVSQLVWNEAVAFCNWLSEQEQLEPSYRQDVSTWILLPGKNGYRLPTEAEWEYACRAGTATQYPFGDDVAQLDQYAWYTANSNNRAHAVGTKLPNAFGLFDMHGNLIEWCQDFYEEMWYETGGNQGPQKTNPNANRVLRGGLWIGSASQCRSAFRYNYVPNGRFNGHGFRIVRTVSSAPQVSK